MIQTPEGETIKGNKNILEHCKQYFQQLYASRVSPLVNDQGSDAFVIPENCPRLSDVEKLSCEGPLTFDECKFALSSMMNNKSPSVSGFTKELFLFFWNEIGQFIVDYLNEAYETSHLFYTQRRGILTLIPKKGDQKLLRNKRPICLLDVVYKIAAKAIANRLSKVINQLVSRDQTGAIKGRYIGENLRSVADIIAYCEEDQLDGILMALDFKNAYNTVEYSFLYATLRKFNFGEEFIRWIEMLHTDMEIAVSNNGFTSNWIKPSRGLQQGSPSSGLLFVLVAEMLAITIREARNIRGITVSGCEAKLSMYCDDITAFVADEQAAKAVIDMVVEFGKASGLELNLEKCHFMRLGRDRDESSRICEIEPVEKVKILGVWFSAISDCRKDNIGPVTDKIQRTLNAWSQRDLTLKGFITVAKSLVISQLTYIMTCMKVEEEDLKPIQSLIMKFLWRGRPPKVAKRTLIQGIEEGGLKAPDLMLIYRTTRAAWAKRIANARHASFVKILEARMRPLAFIDILKMNYNSYFIDNTHIPYFYKDALRWFRELCPIQDPRNGKDVRKQQIWQNRAIVVGGKPIFHRRLYCKGVKSIDDFLDSNGNLLTYQGFQEKHPRIRINVLTYLGWCRAIPRQWRTLLDGGSAPLIAEEREEMPGVDYKDKRFTLQQISCRLLYMLGLQHNIPTAQVRWIQEGIDFGDRWACIHRLPFRITTSTRLQSLQYRITHRFFPTRRYLHTRRVVDDPFCDECGLVDSWFHYFFECGEVQEFWSTLFAKINDKLPRRKRVTLTRVNVLFGMPEKLPVVNLIILIAKQFIAMQRYKQGLLEFTSFHAYLLKMFAIEKEIAFQNGKIHQFTQKWSPFISAALTLCL